MCIVGGERELRKIYIASILIWIYCVGVIKCENYFTSNSENFESVPTTIKTSENDTVLLPCYSVGELNYSFFFLSPEFEYKEHILLMKVDCFQLIYKINKLKFTFVKVVLPLKNVQVTRNYNFYCLKRPRLILSDFLNATY